MPVTKVDLSSLEFGETYHIGAAMILAPKSNMCQKYHLSYKSDSDYPMTNAQLNFLNSVLYSPSYPRDGNGVNNNGLAKNECTEDIIAPAFANSPTAAGNIVRKCFLIECLNNYQGEAADDAAKEMSKKLTNFIKTQDDNLKTQSKRAIIRIRNKVGQNRNITKELVGQIATSLKTNANIQEIIFVGDSMDLPPEPSGVSFIDLRGFLNDTKFKEISGQGESEQEDFSFVAQLMFFFVLFRKYEVKMQVGMMSGAMDGTAFIGVPTIFFEEQSGAAPAANSRMGQAATAIPNMEQVSYVSGSFDSSDSKKSSMPAATITALDTAIVNLNKL
ncbi:hypothetical protein [Pseudotenacibaculum haliotis]|uniref:Uncharacterized protein n=1 Tax=Pseudotenacibaculum haliotis TaxID=1862138 RepID=A0ABW5LUR6_9FLAO